MLEMGQQKLQIQDGCLDDLTFDGWESGRLDFELLDHLTTTMLDIRWMADTCAISPTAFLFFDLPE